jgi:cell division protein FtsB
LEKLKDAAKDSALAQQMAEVARQLESQIKQLQGEVNQLTAQNQQLKTENQDLTAGNQKQSSQLKMRHPFLAVAASYPRKTSMCIWTATV